MYLVVQFLFIKIVLLLERMDKILEMNEDAMYMVVEAGARTSEIQAKLMKQVYCMQAIRSAESRINRW